MNADWFATEPGRAQINGLPRHGLRGDDLAGVVHTDTDTQVVRYTVASPSGAAK